MSIVRLLVILLFLGISGCSEMMDDLNPTGTDKSYLSSDVVPIITVKNSVAIDKDVPVAATPTVIYFTMWCLICDMHIKDMLYNTVPHFPGVSFFLVDYVSATVAQVRSNELAWGYGPSFTTLADIDDLLQNHYNGTMGTTVVIDSAGIIRMNEDYLDGSRLRNILTEIATP